MLCSLLKIGNLALVIERFSELILTLGQMLMSTNSILVIMLIWMLMYIQLGSTEYADLHSDYKNITESIRISYDSFMAAYGYGSFSSLDPIQVEDDSIYLIVMILQLFMTNILLLNFMVAILSDSQAAGEEVGSFKFKCAKYNYCERYMLAR